MTPSAAADVRAGLERDLEAHRLELRAYCYRMLGSAFDADDAVQEALVRAWRHIDRFEGRAALRSWLYRIATNVCLDIIKANQRRALPTDLAAAGRPDQPLGVPLAEREWLEPVALQWLAPAAGDPAERAVVRESVRLAFVAALQVLPARQRAALVLRDVLAWRPGEIAELLGTTVASVNSALQRARDTLASTDTARRSESAGAVSTELLDRYVEALEHDDLDTIVTLLHDDAVWSMPPYALWFRGADAIRGWLERKPCGDVKLVALDLNGSAGFALYRASATPGLFEGFGLQVLDVQGGAIAAAHTFLDERLLPLFGVSPTLAA